MRAPKIYIETSVFNFVFADDAPDKRHDVLVLFDEICHGKYKPYSSAYVLRELRRAPEPKRGKMFSLLERYAVTILPADDEAQKLAEKYVSEGIVPEKYLTDALHIAITGSVEVPEEFYKFQNVFSQKLSPGESERRI